MDRFALSAILHRALGYAASGYPIKTGAILNFHSVRDLSPGALNWTRSLTVTPKFIEGLLIELRHQNVTIVSLAEAIDRSNSQDPRPFVAITFDDGYADNFHRAFPIFQRHEAPFTIFLPTGFIDRTIPMWWSILEFLVENNNYLVLPETVVMARNRREKNSALAAGLNSFRNIHPDEMGYRIDNLLSHYPGTGARERALDLPLTWQMIHSMAKSGLVTFGAHTVHHPKLSHLDSTTIENETVGSRNRITEQLGSPPRFFAYPYGGSADINQLVLNIIAKSKFEAAFTTERRLIARKDEKNPLLLPRISVSGHYQHNWALSAYFMMAKHGW